jgi:fermentation-respiration switch protein FrsA (DUF1100 family)
MGFLVLRQFELSQVYHPDRELEASGRELGRPFEEVWFRAADGVQLNGWFFAAETNSPRRSLAFLFCHGNAGNISHRLESCQILLTTGVNVLLFDYRGYGRSQGKPSEAGTYLDGQAAYDWLRNKGFAGRNILVYGESLGGGVGAELCSTRETGGLVLQSTFTSIPDLGAELFPWLPVRWLARIQYDTHRKLPHLRVPILVMHSRTDGLIGYRHAERNFAAANEPKRFCELEGSHNDALAAREKFVAGIEDFLQMVETGRR